jgi:hypothetical protein
MDGWDSIPKLPFTVAMWISRFFQVFGEDTHYCAVRTAVRPEPFLLMGNAIQNSARTARRHSTAGTDAAS